MRLFCPNCMKPVTVPDETAGAEANCPNCGKPFPVPARYNPVVAAPPPAAVPPVLPPEPTPMSTGSPADRPPPGLVPTALVPPPAAHGETPVPPTPPAPPGYTRSFGIVFSPWWVAWVPAVGLTIAFLATFFPWDGSYFGDNPVDTETPWQAVTGNPTRNFKMEGALTKEFTDLNPTAMLEKVPGDWYVMLPYLVLLILAMLLAWGDRFVPVLPDPYRLPPPLRWLTQVWPHRALILAALAGASAVLIVGEIGRGLPLERAIRRAVTESPKVVDAWKQAGESEVRQGTAKVVERQELDKWGPRRTWALTIGVGCHILAVVGLGTVALLHRRGTKPPPRIVVQY